MSQLAPLTAHRVLVGLAFVMVACGRTEPRAPFAPAAPAPSPSASAQSRPQQEIWYHSGYPGGVVGPDEGMSAMMGPTKMPRVFAGLVAAKLVPAEQLHADGVDGAKPPAPPIDLASLRAVHHDDYLKALFTGEPAELATSQGLDAWSPEIARGWLLNVGGLYAAAVRAIEAGTITANIGHGYHHASPARGGGFCTINGLAVVARRVVAEGRAERVMVIDLDTHEGNGTADAIIGDPALSQASIYSAWMGGPGPAPNNHVLEVEPDADEGRALDIQWLAVIARELPRRLEQHQPQLIIYQAGMDPYEGANMSARSLATRDAFVFALARARGIPVVWVLAGGYADMKTLVELHLGTVRAANDVLATVAPGAKLVLEGGAKDPYAWVARAGEVRFPDWPTLAGPVTVESQPALSDADASRFALERRARLERAKLPDAELQAAYSALFTGGGAR